MDPLYRAYAKLHEELTALRDASSGIERLCFDRLLVLVDQLPPTRRMTWIPLAVGAFVGGTVVLVCSLEGALGWLVLGSALAAGFVASIAISLKQPS